MDELNDLQEFANDEVNRFVNKEFSPEAFNRNASLDDYINPWSQLIDYRFEKSGLILIYPIGEINNNILITLSQYSEWKNYWGPQDYFDLLYDIMKEILIREDKPGLSVFVFEKIMRYDFNVKKKGYLLFGLISIIKKIIEPIDIRPYIIEKALKWRPLMKLYLSLIENPEIYKPIKQCQLPSQYIDPIQKIEHQKYILTCPQIALVCYYNGVNIPNEIKGANVAEKYGRVQKTSGHELYQDFLKIKDDGFRTGVDNSPRELKYKIERYEVIDKYLSEEGKVKAANDLRALKLRL